jgi:hypothetical protein
MTRPRRDGIAREFFGKCILFYLTLVYEIRSTSRMNYDGRIAPHYPIFTFWELNELSTPSGNTLSSVRPSRIT